MALINTDNGYQGRLVSLSGIMGQDGQGRSSIGGLTTMTATPVMVLASNPKRIAALIENLDDVANPGSGIELYFGNPSIYPVAQIILSPLGTIQIDQDLPWTGEVWAANVVNSPVISVMEIAIL